MRTLLALLVLPVAVLAQTPAEMCNPDVPHRSRSAMM